LQCNEKEKNVYKTMVMELNNTITIQQLKKKEMTLVDGKKNTKETCTQITKVIKYKWKRQKKPTIKLSKIKHKEIRATKEGCHFGRRKKC
jgi:hypothetical protein